MALTVVNETIGTGGDHSTIQLWEDNIDADLTTGDGKQYNGLCLDEVLSTCDMSGHTTSATQYIHLTTDTGASFADDDTNALIYDESQGMAASASSGWSYILKAGSNYTRISKLQVQNYSGAGWIGIDVTGTNVLVERCILYIDSNTNRGTIYSTVADTDVVNCLHIADETSPAGSATLCTVRGTDGNVINNTFVMPHQSHPAGRAGLEVVYNRPTTTNNASFGFTSPYCFRKNGGSAWVGDYNASDDTSAPGANSFTSETYTATTPFVDADNAVGGDFKLANDGNNLIDGGTRHTLTGDIDIFGNPRSLTTPSIGCHEIQAAGGARPQGAVFRGPVFNGGVMRQ